MFHFKPFSVLSSFIFPLNISIILMTNIFPHPLIVFKGEERGKSILYLPLFSMSPKVYLPVISFSLLVFFPVVCIIIFSVCYNILFTPFCRVKTSKWLTIPGISQVMAHCLANRSSTETTVNTLIGFSRRSVRSRGLHLAANIHKYTFH